MKCSVSYTITHPATGVHWEGWATIEQTPVIVVPDAIKAIRQSCNSIPECPLGPVVITNIQEEVIADEA